MKINIIKLLRISLFFAMLCGNDFSKGLDHYRLRAESSVGLNAKAEPINSAIEEFEKGIYTGHFSWNNQKISVDKMHEEHAKIFEFNPKVLDGGKDKNK